MVRSLYRLYAAALFFALHVVLVTYVHSTYLENFIPSTSIGVLYALGACLGILLLSYTPHLLRRYGNKNFMLAIACSELVTLATMAWGGNAYAVLAAFAIHQAVIPSLYFNFDIFLKHFSSAEEAGESRGIFLSMVNIAYVIVPLAMGTLLGIASINIVYLISLLFVPPLILLIYSIKDFADPYYHDVNIIQSLRESWHDRDIFSIIVVNGLLQMFYATMVIYVPLLLHEHIGFSWPVIGGIFTVMLLPFILFELPLGKISDHLWGEKEVLIAGIIIMILSTGIIFFTNTKNPALWMIILFMTRMGASFVEIMAESYFFKKIKEEDAELLSLWRSLSSAGYIIIPLIMSLVLSLTGSIHTIFIVMACILCLGLPFAFRIKDTL